MIIYYTPSDANIDKLGIPPDREVLFPELDEAGEKALTELLQTTKLADFVAGKPALTGAEAEAFARTLSVAYPVEIRVLKRLVLQEYYRTHITPLYDMEYDVQLKAAVDVLLKEDVAALLRSTKTVKELQEIELARQAAAAPASSSDAAAPAVEPLPQP